MCLSFSVSMASKVNLNTLFKVTVKSALRSDCFFYHFSCFKQLLNDVQENVLLLSDNTSTWIQYLKSKSLIAFLVCRQLCSVWSKILEEKKLILFETCGSLSW